LTGPKKRAWVDEYFTAALDELDRLRDVLRLSAEGISTIPAVPRLVAVLGKPPEKIEAANQRAELAKKEIERGFATLNGFGVVALWSWLETFVIDFVVLCIERRFTSLETLKVPKVRIDLAEYATMRGRDRARFIVDVIDRELAGPLRNGLGRFDSLLEAVGINVPLESEYRRKLFELQQVRNCLSHRFGVADARLVEACPWLKLKKGQRLAVTQGDVQAYAGSGGRYLLLLLYEVGDVIGVDYRSAGEGSSGTHD